MKNFVKPSLLLIFSLVLGTIGVFFLPITKIHYQIVDESQSNVTGTMIVNAIGYTRAYGDKYGIEALPCEFPRFDLPSSSYPRSYGLWQWTGKVLGIVLFSFGLTYVRRRKVSGFKPLMFVAILIAIPFSVALLFPENRPMCNPNFLYKITSFTPYLPTIILLIGGILLGYSATRSKDDREAMVTSSVGTSAL